MKMRHFPNFLLVVKAGKVTYAADNYPELFNLKQRNHAS
jgi:hypothetical protein